MKKDPKQSIYLDYNATTPVDSRVLEDMLPYFTQFYGNPASRNHLYGWKTEEAIKIAREEVADLLDVDNKELIFTSGATESINLAIKGIFESYRQQGDHIITCKTEHKAVLDVCEYITKIGGKVTYLDVDNSGVINLQHLEDAITDNTILVCIMWANNETGVLQPIKKIGEICAQKRVLFFSDATQAVGKITTHPKAMGIHLMACSAHKMYGPKGVGALYISSSNPRVVVRPQMLGGGHERGKRSGTLNVPGIVGLGTACKIAKNEMETNARRLTMLRDRLESALLAIEGSYINGEDCPRLGHVSNIGFLHVESEALITSLRQAIAVSTGSACTSASLEASHVLTSMGLSDDKAFSSIRFSLGQYTTEAEIEETIRLIHQGVSRLRENNPIWSMYKEGIL